MSNQTTIQSTPKRGDIQGLRAIAVALVIMNHLNITYFSGGFIGVDIFFTISGYLISAIIIDEFTTSGKFNYVNFYTRRVKRLLPSLLFMCAITIVVATIFLTKYEILMQLGSTPYALSWISNFYFAFEGINYFDELQDKDLFLHTWSLAVEEQFYLVWPALIIAIFSIKSITNQPARWLIGLTIIGFIGSAILTWIDPKSAFYLMPTRIWQFSTGALIYFAGKNLKRNSYRITKHLTPVGLGILAIAMVLITPETNYPGIAASLPTAGAALLLLAGSGSEKNPLGQALSNKPLIFIGDRSYSLYLWHWPLILLIPNLAPSLKYSEAAILLALIIITELNYRLIEIPFWRGRFSNSSITNTFIYSIATTLFLAAMFITLPIIKDIASQHEHKSQNPALAARSDKPIIYSMGCDSWYTNADLTPCLLGDKNAKKTAVVIGDSIGLQWLPVIQLTHPDPSWKIIVLTKSSCAMVDEEYMYKRIGKIYTTCSEWRSKAIEYIEKIQPDLTYIGSAATYEFTDQQWIEGSTRIISKISAASNETFLIPGTPMLAQDGPSCIVRQERPDRILKNCSTNYENSVADKVPSFLEQSIKDFDSVHLLNLNNIVCPNKICPAVAPNKAIIFRDQQHLTATYTTSIKEAFKAQIIKARTDTERKRQVQPNGHE